jgi:hypothetical protein
MLGLFFGPFLLDGLVRFLGDLPVRRFVRHVALPNVGALNRPRACKVRLFCRECNWHHRRLRAPPEPPGAANPARAPAVRNQVLQRRQCLRIGSRFPRIHCGPGPA